MGSTLFLYLTLLIVGIFLGSKLIKRDIEYKLNSYVQGIALILVIFTMGARIGSDKRVLESLDTIGLSALLISVCAIAGSVGVTFLGRKLLGIDKEGQKNHD